MAKAKAKVKAAPVVKVEVPVVKVVAPVVEKIIPEVVVKPVVEPVVEKVVTKVVVEKRQGPFEDGSSDNAFGAAHRWAVENNINAPVINVSHNRDSNKHDAWVIYETTE